MKTLFIIMFAAVSISLFAQNKRDTMILKDDYNYCFTTISKGRMIEVKNETTYKQYRDLVEERRTTNSEIENENKRIDEYIRNKETNIQYFLLETVKKVFSDTNLEHYNHKILMNFVIIFKSSGEILDISVWSDREILNVVGYDKLIEFESEIRKGYKVRPFLNQDIKYKTVVMVMLKPEQLNAVFK